MTTRLHISWFIAVICAGFVAGVATALMGFLPSYCVVCIILLPVVFIVRWRVIVVLALAVSIVLGNVYGGHHRIDQSRLNALHGSTVTMSGRVKEDPSAGSKGSVTLQLDSLQADGYSVAGTLWASTMTKTEILRGDTVTLRGQLQPGFGTFVGMMARASVVEVVRPVPGDTGRVVRDWFASAVRLGIPEPQASLGIGFLTGQKSALPEDLADALQIAGLSHIVVASGYNLTILVRLSRRLFVRRSKYLATMVSSVMICGFVAITGLSPSMTRAGLVSGLSLAAWYYGRISHPFVLLPFVAALTVLWNPSYAWGDLGWQLSFTAFLGVMIVGPLIQSYFFGEKEPGILRQVAGETIAAHLVTLPLIAMSFGVISHVAIIANMLIVPLVPIAMLLTFIVGIVGLAVPVLSELVGYPVSWLLGYMTNTATFLSELPWAQTEIEPSPWMIIGYVVVLLVACVWMQRKTNLSFREKSIID